MAGVSSEEVFVEIEYGTLMIIHTDSMRWGSEKRRAIQDRVSALTGMPSSVN